MSHRDARDMLTLCVGALGSLIESDAPGPLIAEACLATGVALDVFSAPTLRTPRAVWRQADTSPIPLWAWTRSRRREAAFLRFLGFPTFIFDEIAKRMKDKLPSCYDPDTARALGGRPTRFDYIDMTAMGLRALQIMSPKRTEIIMHEFGCGPSVCSRSLRDARKALHEVATS